jgi:hypothetical protein
VAAKHATRPRQQAPSTPTRCARSFRQYHGQRISHAIVMTDALNIHEVIQKSIYLSILSILKLKKDGSAAPPFASATAYLKEPSNQDQLTVARERK